MTPASQVNLVAEDTSPASIAVALIDALQRIAALESAAGISNPYIWPQALATSQGDPQDD